MKDCRFLLHCRDCQGDKECRNHDPSLTTEGCCDKDDYWEMQGCVCSETDREKCEYNTTELVMTLDIPEVKKQKELG